MGTHTEDQRQGLTHLPPQGAAEGALSSEAAATLHLVDGSTVAAH